MSFSQINTSEEKTKTALKCINLGQVHSLIPTRVTDHQADERARNLQQKINGIIVPPGKKMLWLHLSW